MNAKLSDSVSSEKNGRPTSPFSFDEAFSRTVGWVTEAELAQLRSKRVAIAGLGGVGGSHLLTLTRLGIGNYHLADLDHFELANFNRQAGASISHLGLAKVDVMSNLALDINPTLSIKRFPNGVTHDNVEDFLDGVDLYVDGLDFFAVSARRAVFAACERRGIPALTVAPLGMTAALLVFMPGKMSFEQYFQLEGQDEHEQLLRFLVGLAPRAAHSAHLVLNDRLNLRERRGPSTPMACELCAAVAGTEALKILLRRGRVRAAPHGVQIDAFGNRVIHTFRPLGNAHPLQRFALRVGRRQVAALVGATANAGASSGGTVVQARATAAERILDLARWAPSGDNTQPWRLQILGEDRLVVHGHDRGTCGVYDLHGRAAQIALGTLLETVAIAASGEEMRAEIRRRMDGSEREPSFDISLRRNETQVPDPLLPFIKARVTQRGAMSTRSLSLDVRRSLESALPDGFSVRWLSGVQDRARLARILFGSTHIRLTLRETYLVHTKVIEWAARTSEDRMPDQALGLGLLGRRMMRWSMANWPRVNFMNKYFAGTWLPRLQLDVVPALRCGAYFVLSSAAPPRSVDDHIATGRALQRFWLTATSLGLYCQPQMTPIMFAAYARDGVKFTESERALHRAQWVASELDSLLGREVARNAAFLCRIGYGAAPTSRSLRLPLERLLRPVPNTPVTG